MDKKALFAYQNELFRYPLEIVGAHLPDSKALRKSLEFKADQGFIDIINKLNIALFTTREYEHLILAFTSDGKQISQSYYPLPHPSGMAIQKNRLVVASTRNPNQIVEFYPSQSYMERIEDRTNDLQEKVMMPARSKFYPGAYYFHDLAYVGDELYGNSVGQNGVIKIDFSQQQSEEVIWSPIPRDHNIIKGNYLQLNSIAAGNNLKESFFSASSPIARSRRPGHRNFPVDGRGVIFSGEGHVIAHGLTRPHSTRIHQENIWVNNSGYGSLGFIQNEKYHSFKSFPGWTRGLHFINNIAFVGVSRVLSRFENYAPGLKGKKSISAIFALNTQTGEVIGKIEFPNGNQIFGIESMDRNLSNGFLFNNINRNTKRIKSHFYKYKI